ncbi:hypothetical protein Tco_0772021 [Tanacetum coccineum]|uniref:Uncharacterized protein n=1 Tax=Tanacetum coccineum TaxID=301880 RepID=A0ABQ4ZH09_9ASTR
MFITSITTSNETESSWIFSITTVLEDEETSSRSRNNIAIMGGLEASSLKKILDVDNTCSTIFGHARMEATLRDSLSNLSRNAEDCLPFGTINKLHGKSDRIPNDGKKNPPRPLYNKDLFFLKYGNTKEKKYILSLHKIHAEERPDLEEKLNRWVRKEFKTFNEDARLSIQHWKDSWHKRPDRFSEADSRTEQKTILKIVIISVEAKETVDGKSS